MKPLKMKTFFCVCALLVGAGGCEPTVAELPAAPVQAQQPVVVRPFEPPPGEALGREAALAVTPDAVRGRIERAFLDRPAPTLGQTGWATEAALDQGSFVRHARLYFGVNNRGRLTGQLQLSDTFGPARHRPDRVLALRHLVMDKALRSVKGTAGPDGEFTFWLTWTPDLVALKGRMAIRTPHAPFGVNREVRFERVGAPLWCERVCLGRVCDASTARCITVAPEGSDVVCLADAHCAKAEWCRPEEQGAYCAPDAPPDGPDA